MGLRMNLFNRDKTALRGSQPPDSNYRSVPEVRAALRTVGGVFGEESDSRRLCEEVMREPGIDSAVLREFAITLDRLASVTKDAQAVCHMAELVRRLKAEPKVALDAIKAISDSMVRLSPPSVVKDVVDVLLDASSVSTTAVNEISSDLSTALILEHRPMGYVEAKLYQLLGDI